MYMLMASVLEPRMAVQEFQEFQEPLVLELICSRTAVHELQLFKNNSSRTSSVEELQSIQEQHRFMNISSSRSRTEHTSL